MASASYLAMRAYHRWRLLGGLLRGRRNRWRGVRILGYHRLAESGGSLSVSPAAFKRQMEIVLESGATAVSLGRAFDLIGDGVEEQFVAVTFDDGYLDNIEHGEPVLRALGIPATIFLPTAIIDGRAGYFWYDEPPAALRWEDIERVPAEGLISFESHTVTHRWLTQLSDAEVLGEFTDSKSTVEQHTGSTVTSVAFPGGLYGAREQRLLVQAGYRAGLTTSHGVNCGGQDLTALRRTLIYSGDGPADFAAKLSGLLDGPARLRSLLYPHLGPTRNAPVQVRGDQ
jgi:peptidoglycan/xylan/chitin deacetylase (PgdA/CDA1 family)